MLAFRPRTSARNDVGERKPEVAERIVVAGALAQRAGQGGHSWVFLQYLLGFRRLGFDVLFLDRLEPGMCVDERGSPCEVECSVNLRYLLEVMRAFGLERSFSLFYDRGKRIFGVSGNAVREQLRSSLLLLNVMGYLDDPELLAAAPRRVFLDIDPGFGQMWQALGLHETFRGHDDHVTIAERIGQADCEVPSCGISWITTPQPVVLDQWTQQPDTGSMFTSVASWRGPYAPLEYGGKRYGLRVHEFRKFMSLPRLTGRPFEVALEIHSDEKRDLALLAENGWRLVDPTLVVGDPLTYRRYIQRSGAEFSVAKGMYVESRGGWFSDRSICYLASGKPVLAQNTGLEDLYPAGEGLLLFASLDEAAAGVEEILANYKRHARAARALAEAHFDSDKVLTELLAKLGVA